MSLPLLRYDDVSRMLGRSIVTLRRDQMAGRGPVATRIGRQVRFRPEDVEEYLNNCRRTSGHATSKKDVRMSHRRGVEVA
jgi:predicted site-specific integrase-resolvase